MAYCATITLCLETQSNGSSKILKSLICNNLATLFIFTLFFNCLKTDNSEWKELLKKWNIPRGKENICNCD